MKPGNKETSSPFWAAGWEEFIRSLEAFFQNILIQALADGGLADDANVTRYGRYMRTLAGRTQFIVITHRRGTMEEADVLYGVTMQEQGVSKILTINMNDLARELKIQ